MAPGRVVLCLGGGPSFDQNWRRWHELYPDVEYDVAACNDAGVEYPGPLVLWASLHTEKMPGWYKAREANHYPMWGMLRACNTGGVKRPFVHKVIARGDGSGTDWNGSSGLYVAQVAVLTMGYRRAVLIGIPMDNGPNRFRDEDKWADAIRYREGWGKAAQCAAFAPYVRSMGGWTAELLGEPDTGWLSGA